MVNIKTRKRLFNKAETNYQLAFFKHRRPSRTMTGSIVFLYFHLNTKKPPFREAFCLSSTSTAPVTTPTVLQAKLPDTTEFARQTRQHSRDCPASLPCKLAEIKRSTLRFID
ncbi:hypothetical protein [uncultured Treponema sp.]|uniref:hypothetical protein n=1 Tax=uncultured Treponema sp. TaxID=162155 RepID=UPI0025D965A1|nr:hypothetical protein [uncultured Treponema sp.]